MPYTSRDLRQAHSVREREDRIGSFEGEGSLQRAVLCMGQCLWQQTCIAMITWSLQEAAICLLPLHAQASHEQQALLKYKVILPVCTHCTNNAGVVRQPWKTAQNNI